MVKKTNKPKVKEAKVIPMKDRMKSFSGDLLQGAYDEAFLKRNGMHGRTLKRKLRYWCFRIRLDELGEKKAPAGVPKGLKKFVESLPGFAGWKYFAVSWDIKGDNPFMIVLRLQSVWEEWDMVMQRVAIPIDAPPEQIHARMEALAEEYNKKNK